jgi:hypothetical protein
VVLQALQALAEAQEQMELQPELLEHQALQVQVGLLVQLDQQAVEEE